MTQTSPAPRQEVVPGTYRYVSEKGVRTLAFIVAVSPSFSVHYQRVSLELTRSGLRKAKWRGFRRPMVVVLDELPTIEAIAHAVNVAGLPKGVAA